MKKLLHLSVIAIIFLTGCNLPSGQASLATPTPISMVDAGLELIRQDMIDRVTQKAVENERIEAGARMTATQLVLDAAATQRAYQERQEQAAAVATATERAWSVTVEAARAQDAATAKAQETSTAVAFVQATGTAVMQSTQNSVKATEDTAAWSARATAQSAQAESAQLAADRERMTNGVIAWGPWSILVIVLLIAAFVVYRKSQVGTIVRDANGMMPGVVIFSKGRKMLISPDRMFSPVIEVGQGGVSAPQLADPDRQEGATRRDQAVQAINALPAQAQKQGMGLMAQTFNTASRPAIEVVDSNQVSGWVDEAETKLGEEL